MTARVAAPLAILALLASACGTGARAPGPEATPYAEGPSAVRAQAGLKDAKGNTIGFAELIEVRQGVQLTLKVLNLPPGKHGVHIHAVGKCDPGKEGQPDFASAGGHFNPDSAKKHGLDSPAGPHGGDLPNLEVGSDGKGELLAVNPNVSLNEAAGNSILKNPTALVIHEKEDDGKTDPTGNSGGRIACGVIAKVRG